MNKFKVLLVYPNLMLVSLLPNNIALLSACLKEAGFDVKVFDTTLYKTADKSNDEMRVDRMQVRKFNINDAGIDLKKSNVYLDFVKAVEDYEPDLIGVSVVDETVEMGLKLVSGLNRSVPVIFGGVHAIFNPDWLIHRDEVDMVCIGEGEAALVELCKRLMDGRSYNDIENLWIKNDREIIKNDIRRIVDINSLPFEDFSVFEPQRLVRPMQGKMVSMLPINFDRGCPYRCTFCNAPSISSYYSDFGFKYYRAKTTDRIYEEMKHLSKSPIAYFYFNSETFLAGTLSKLQEFAAMYSEFGLPFWCQTRIETVTDEKVKLLKEMNCDRVSIGLEHGNEEFRKKMLNKNFTNEQAIKAFDIFNKYGVKVSVNNVIGFPDETRELVFDTINLNREINVDSVNGFVFQPFYGTYLRKYCIERGYLNPTVRINNLIGKSMLNMPQFTSSDIEGLIRTFVLYIKLPKSYYPKIEQAERDDTVLEELRQVFFENYF